LIFQIKKNKIKGAFAFKGILNLTIYIYMYINDEANTLENILKIYLCSVIRFVCFFFTNTFLYARLLYNI